MFLLTELGRRKSAHIAASGTISSETPRRFSGIADFNAPSQRLFPADCFNERTIRVDHLFQGRFKSFIIEKRVIAGGSAVGRPPWPQSSMPSPACSRPIRTIFATAREERRGWWPPGSDGEQSGSRNNHPEPGRIDPEPRATGLASPAGACPQSEPNGPQAASVRTTPRSGDPKPATRSPPLTTENRQPSPRPAPPPAPPPAGPPHPPECRPLPLR